MDSVSLYIDIVVGIASVILLVIILVVVIRRRRQHTKRPVLANEGGTLSSNNLNTTDTNIPGTVRHHDADYPVDLSNETKANPNTNIQNYPVILSPRPSVKYGFPAADDQDGVENIKVPSQGLGWNLNSAERFCDSETKSNNKTDRELYPNHTIPNKKGKGEVFTLGSSIEMESGIREKCQCPPVNNAKLLDDETDFERLNSSPYNTLYDLNKFASNQYGDILKPGAAIQNKTHEDEETNDSPYSQVYPTRNTIRPKLEMEEQTTTGDRSNYEELKLQKL